MPINCREPVIEQRWFPRKVHRVFLPITALCLPEATSSSLDMGWRKADPLSDLTGFQISARLWLLYEAWSFFREKVSPLKISYLSSQNISFSWTVARAHSTQKSWRRSKKGRPTSTSTHQRTTQDLIPLDMDRSIRLTVTIVRKSKSTMNLFELSCLLSSWVMQRKTEFFGRWIGFWFLNYLCSIYSHSSTEATVSYTFQSLQIRFLMVYSWKCQNCWHGERLAALRSKI